MSDIQQSINPAPTQTETPRKFNPIQKWDKEKAFYKTAIVDQKTKQTWPYTSTDEAKERSYRIWLEEVTDPITGEPYRGKIERVKEVLEDGTEVKELYEPEWSQRVHSIQRNRLANGQEFLLTKGQFVGFNEFGEEKTFPYSFIERYTETVWLFRRAVNQQTNRLVQECLGPKTGSEIIHHTLPFTENNVKRLYEMADPTTVSLLVKDVKSGEAKECPNIDMFRTKSFDYIKNMDYLSEKEKAQKLEEFKALQNESQVKTKRS